MSVGRQRGDPPARRALQVTLLNEVRLDHVFDGVALFADGRRHVVKADGRITQAVAQAALAMLDVDPQGFDLMDRKLLEAVIHRFDGGPVGLDNIAASIGEERDTIEDVIEPFLIQQGFLQRTPRGRIATLAAYRHLGVAAPQRESGLFGE